jgi:hypothetical protein
MEGNGANPVLIQVLMDFQYIEIMIRINGQRLVQGGKILTGDVDYGTVYFIDHADPVGHTGPSLQIIESPFGIPDYSINS